MRSDLKAKSKAIFPSTRMGEKGFSVIELLITMVIFLIVTGAVYGLLEVGRVQRNRSSRRSDIMKNARVAVQLIGRDALNAGYGFNRHGARVPDNFIATTFGMTADAGTERDLLSSIVVGNDVFTNNLSLNPATRTDLVAFCYRDQEFNLTPPPIPAGTIATGRVVQLKDVQNPVPATPQLVAKDPTGAASAQINDLYLIESDTIQTAIMATAVSGTNTIDAAPGDPLGLNQPYNGVGSLGSVLRKCGPDAPGPPPVPDSNCTKYLNSTLVRFFMISYKVKADGTLVRTVYGNNRGAGAAQQVVEQPLAYNVEDLQLQYVLDDGFVTDNPVTGKDQIPGTADDDETAVNRIRQIMVTIKVQSTEIDEQTRTPETITLNATFSTRNMEYDAG